VVIGEQGSCDGGTGGQAVVGLDDAARITGWKAKPQGWCRGEICRPSAQLASGDQTVGIVALDVAQQIGAVVVVDREHRIVSIGGSESTPAIAPLEVAPNVTLPRMNGERGGLLDDTDGKRMVVAFSSWCGCRYDLPLWQKFANELDGPSLQIVAVAIDQHPEDVAPWVEDVDFDVFLDPDRSFCDAYGITNVPTVVWIDADGEVVRSNSIEFADDTFVEFHGVQSGPHLDQLRSWVVDDQIPADASALVKDRRPATAEEREGRAAFRIATELAERGDRPAATEWVARAEALAPDDFTIWRAGLQLVGEDPFGPKFFERYEAWKERTGQAPSPI